MNIKHYVIKSIINDKHVVLFKKNVIFYIMIFYNEKN